MDNIWQLAAVVGIIAIVLYMFLSRKKVTKHDEEHSRETSNTEAQIVGSGVLEDPYEQLMPQVTNVQDKEIVKNEYKKIEIPGILKTDIRQTLAAGAMIIEDYNTYKVEFSPEVVKGLKDGSMSLIKKVDGKGHLPAVNKQGIKGIYKQGVLVKKINPGMVANASFGLLTAVVGQQQLVEIQSSLKNIERKLDIIIQNRDNDFAGKIEARFSYFKEVIERFRRNGITLGGVEDHKIEDFYAGTLQDLKTLMKDLKTTGTSIEELKEYENIRKWGEAPVQKEYVKLIEQFNAKQELVLLNIQFIEECYEPYLRIIRNQNEANVKSQGLTEVITENNSIINSIEDKVKSIEENYKVKVNFGIKALKYRDLESLKEIAPLKISQQKAAAQEIPSEILVEITGDDKAYAYVPR